MPHVYITVPGVESLTSVVTLLRIAGAQGTGGRREFVVSGSLAAEQATAVWQLAEYVDSGSEGRRLAVRVEPAGDLRAALDVMCPDGWQDHAPVIDEFDLDLLPHFSFDRAGLSNDQWWREQQRPQPPTPEPAPQAVAPVAPAPEGERRMDGTCCGQAGTWAPKEGEPVVVGCMLCPQSATYWRANRTTTPTSG